MKHHYEGCGCIIISDNPPVQCPTHGTTCAEFSGPLPAPTPPPAGTVDFEKIIHDMGELFGHVSPETAAGLKAFGEIVWAAAFAAGEAAARKRAAEVARSFPDKMWVGLSERHAIAAAIERGAPGEAAKEKI